MGTSSRVSSRRGNRSAGRRRWSRAPQRETPIPRHMAVHLRRFWRSLSRGIRRFWVPLAFVGVGVCTLIAGWLVFPAPNTLHAAATIGVAIYPTEQNDAVEVRVTPLTAQSSRVELTVASPDPATQNPPPSLSTRIHFPSGSVVHGCERLCLKQSLGMHWAPGDGSSPRWESTQVYTVENPGSVVLANDDNGVEGVLPQVYGTEQLDSINLWVGLAGAPRYDWTGGPPPNTVEPGRVRWVLDPGLAKQGEQPVTAVDRVAQAHDTAKTLWAGILLGIGGAALIAALQEYLHVRLESHSLGATSPTAWGSQPQDAPGTVTVPEARPPRTR